MSLYDWSIIPAENADSDPNISQVEGQQLPASVNDNSRQAMARIAEWLADMGATATSTGTDNAYAVTIQTQIDGAAGYFNGLVFYFRADRSNSGPATIAVTPAGGTPMGATPLRASGGASQRELAAGEIQPGVVYGVFHDGTQAVVLNPSAGTVTIDALDANTQGRLVPMGTPIPWLTDTAPAGYLICDGSAVSRTTYADLFAVYGTTYGAGDGSTTWNLPDLRGYFPRGLDPTGTVDPDVASRTDRGDGTTGANVGTKQADQTGPHDHGMQAAGDHTHNLLRAGGSASPAQTMIFTALSGINQGTGGNIGGTANLSLQNAGSHTHDITALATSESRPKNIACNWIVLADAAAAAGAQINAAGLSGWGYTFDDDTDTTTDPGVGQVRLDGPIATAVELAVSDQTADTGNADISSVYASMAAVAGPIKGTVKLVQGSAPEIFALYDVTAVNTAPAGFSRLTLASPPTGSNGAFTDGMALQLQVTEAVPGETGATGPTGPNLGLDYQWNTATTGDPGAGKALLNGGGTTLSISKTNRQGKDQSATIATWDNSTNPANRGHLNIVDTADAGSNFLNFHITGALVDQGTYFNAPVTQQSTGDPITNDAIIGILFAPAGDKGLDGAGSGDVVGPASSTANAIAGYANTTGKLLQDTPVTIDPANGNMAGVGSFTGSGTNTSLDFRATGTGANLMPAGTTAQEPVGNPGNYRYDTTLNLVRAFINGAWDTLANLAAVHVWVRGQRKTITVLTPVTQTYTPNLDSSNDFDLGAAFTEARTLNTPTATTALATNTAIAGEISYATGAGGSLVLGAGWNTPDNGGITIGASETGTLYYRSMNIAAGTVHRIVKVKWTA